MTLFFEIISKKKKGVLYSGLRAILFLFSILFGFAVLVRTKLLKKSYRPKAYTISVGNITAGGTGKTPFTIFLAEALSQKVSTAILLRGYKSEAEHKAPTRVTQNCNAASVGDEACMMSKRLPRVAIFVGKRRTVSAELAVKNGAKCLILDDGMQHLGVCRDLEIVLLDATNAFGYGYLLPRGLLREPLSSLKRADLIVLNRVDQVQDTSVTEKEIRKYTSAPLIKTALAFDGLYDLEGKKQEHTPAKVALFCAIGTPLSFYELVKSSGFEIVDSLYLPDHQPMDEKRLLEFSLQAKSKGASYVLCTEKDMVKLTGKTQAALPLFWVGVQLKIVEGKEIFNGVMQDILHAAS